MSSNEPTPLHQPEDRLAGFLERNPTFADQLAADTRRQPSAEPKPWNPFTIERRKLSLTVPAGIAQSHTISTADTRPHITDGSPCWCGAAPEAPSAIPTPADLDLADQRRTSAELATLAKVREAWWEFGVGNCSARELAEALKPILSPPVLP